MTTYLESLNSALKKTMEDDPQVFLIGEDIVDPYGGAFKVTKGLSTKYPNRVLSTPISEACIVGMATGMALRGMRPVVEIMFGDFLPLAADQIINEMCKFALMFGAMDSSIVIRTPMGGGRGYGPTHSQSLEKLFLGIPGLKVVAPSIFHDAGALLKHAIRDNRGPTLFIEHKLLYSLPLISNDDNELYIHIDSSIPGHPTVQVNNFKTGHPDVVLIGYGGMSCYFKEILKEYMDEEINISIIIPSLLSYVSLMVFADDIKRCERVVLIEEGTGRFGWTAEVANHLYENMGSSFKRPLKRVMAQNTVIPSSRKIEKEVLPGKETIKKAIEEMFS